jgi:hypothetical protein
VSNWTHRDSVNLWSTVTFTNVATYHLNTINEDLNFDVSDSIAGFITANNNHPRFSLKYTTWELDQLVYAKYLHSVYTKTMFKPYIEFFIDDTIQDKTYECMGGVPNKIYLINQTGNNFTDTLSAAVSHTNGLESVSVVNERPGVYSVTITPPVPGIKQEYSTIIWSLGEGAVKKDLITIKNPNQFEETVDYRNLYFYPTTPYTHNIVRQGDVMPFIVVSQIRGKGNVIASTYEYRITSADGFEMVPWSTVSVYRDKMYFNVNTEYFFVEQQYEVWLRNKTNDFTITSNQTHKFKLAMNDKSHMRQLSTSPYYSREIFFGK